jgi:hypothetical protein
VRSINEELACLRSFGVAAYPVIERRCWLPNLLVAEWMCMTPREGSLQRTARSVH